MQLEIEETALKKETDHLSQERLADLQKNLAELHDEFASKKAQWRMKRIPFPIFPLSARRLSR